MLLDDRVLLLDKPPGLTSFAAVRRLRHLGRIAKAGHCGSLDPLATGLLVVCTGVATRVAAEFVALPKAYHARVRFGRATDSYDADGRATRTAPVPALDAARLEAALQRFAGEIEQRPPMVSAVKVQGRRLYELARQGREVERQARRVMVHEIALVALGPEHADIRVRCGRGCYVRSIAHEWGESLGIPAHLEALRRTAIGDFGVERAVTLETLAAMLAAEPGTVVPPAGGLPPAAAVLGVPEALGFLPALHLRRQFEAPLANGVQPVPQALRETPLQDGRHRLLSDDGSRLLGLVDAEGRDGTTHLRLAIVFPSPLPASPSEREAP